MAEFFAGLSRPELVVACATLLGPVLAVQVQKTVEAFSAIRRAREEIFLTLMATRASRLSYEHVRALNLISLAFRAPRFLGIDLDNAGASKTRAAWREYFAVLNIPPEEITDANRAVHRERSDGAFASMLAAMGTDLGFNLDADQVRREIYSPILHGMLDEQDKRIRLATQAILEGRAGLPVVIYPPEALRVNNVPPAPPGPG